MKIVVVGATNNVGFAATLACLAKGHTVTAFVPPHAELAKALQDHPRLVIVEGDVKCHEDLYRGIYEQDAVIHAISSRKESSSDGRDNEGVTKHIIQIMNEVQANRTPGSERLSLWLISGAAVLPFTSAQLAADVLPVHPSSYQNYAFLCNKTTTKAAAGKKQVEEASVRVLHFQCS